MLPLYVLRGGVNKNTAFFQSPLATYRKLNKTKMYQQFNVKLFGNCTNQKEIWNGCTKASASPCPWI